MNQTGQSDELQEDNQVSDPYNHNWETSWIIVYVGISTLHYQWGINVCFYLFNSKWVKWVGYTIGYLCNGELTNNDVLYKDAYTCGYDP
jgi:hypothetical protein